VVAVGCATDKFKAMSRDALEVMSRYDFSQELYPDCYLSSEDYSIHQAAAVPPDPREWKRLALLSRQIVERLEQKVSGPKVYHFFVRAPICLAMGLGASIGTRHEVVIHHYQEGAAALRYVPVINVSAHAVGRRGAMVLKLQPDRDPQQIIVEQSGRLKSKVYASLWFAPNYPTGVEDLGESDGASFIEIRSMSPGEIPVEADWLGVAREVNTALQRLFWEGCSELHLFPSAPAPLAFAIGMGLDIRRRVVVHQWYQNDSVYHEVLRLNELGMPEP
jgi:hypothetical protein